MYPSSQLADIATEDTVYTIKRKSRSNMEILLRDPQFCLFYNHLFYYFPVPDAVLCIPPISAFCLPPALKL